MSLVTLQHHNRDRKKTTNINRLNLTERINNNPLTCRCVHVWCRYHSLIIVPQAMDYSHMLPGFVVHVYLFILLCLLNHKNMKFKWLFSIGKSHTHTQTIISLHTPLSYYCCPAPFINYPNEWINETTCWSHNLLLIPHTIFTHWILLTFQRAGDAFKCLKQPNKKNTLHPKLSLENMLHILHVHIAVANVCERTNFIYLFITDITLYQSPVKEFVLVYYK